MLARFSPEQKAMLKPPWRSGGRMQLKGPRFWELILATEQPTEYHRDSTGSVMATTVPRKRLPTQRILIVEDDPIVAHTLRMALAVDGHSVELAEDGMKALAMFEGATYDLVITDFKMPNMDGMELADAIKQRSPST